MKIQVRSILFALVVPLAACGNGDQTPAVDFQVSDYVTLPKADAQPVSEPVPVIGTDLKAVDVAKTMPTKFTELMAEGKKLVAAGKYGDAKEMFDAAAKLEKKNADVHIEMARMYITMNDKAKAIASANKACKLAPLSSLAWNTLGRAELNAHKYEEAISSFTKSVELNATNAFAWNNLGYTELLLKRYDDAVTHLTEATSLPDATGYMFNNLGTALEQLDQLDDARTAYESGGKLGSVAASSSRKRLEGVDTIHVVAVQDDIEPATPTVKEYELVNEGDIEEETFPPSDEVDEHDDLEVEPGDNATL